MRRATNPVASAAQQLDEMCTMAAPDLDKQTVARIRELIDVTSERSEVDPSWCVIGMLGGTGAGKSSLVNALSGGEVVTAGVRRPTTNEACAVVPRGREPQELLGWLGMRRSPIVWHRASTRSLSSLILRSTRMRVFTTSGWHAYARPTLR